MKRIIRQRVPELRHLATEYCLEIANRVRKDAVALDHVGRDAASVVYDAPRGGSITGALLAGGSILLVAIELPAYRAARWGIPLGGGDLQSANRAQRNDTLRAALPIGGLANDQCPVVILQSACDDLCCARALLIDENRKGKSRPRLRGAVGEITIYFGHTAAKADDFLSRPEKEIRNGASLLQDSAGIGSQVQNQ